jgi:RNA polymerase sigma-70 factor (ECF subfamily)
MRSASKEHAALFPSTRWSAVFAARLDPEKRRAALEGLLLPRWRPLYVLARKHGLDVTAAEDAVQSFLVQLLEAKEGNDLVARLDPARGSLRAYLKTAFRNHLANLGAQERAAKRGGGRKHEDVADLEALLAAADSSPDTLFEKTWALVVFEESLAALEAEFSQGLRRGPFEVLREIFRFGTALPYPELAAKHGMTLSQLKSFVHRAKVRFREIVRDRIVETLAEEDDPDAEVRRLLEVMGS